MSVATAASAQGETIEHSHDFVRVLVLSADRPEFWADEAFGPPLEVRLVHTPQEFQNHVTVDEHHVLVADGSFPEPDLAVLLRAVRNHPSKRTTLVLLTNANPAHVFSQHEDKNHILVLPRSLGSTELNMLLTELGQRARQQCEAEHLTAILEGLVTSLVQALELRQPVEAGHSRRVANYALAIAHAIGLDPTDAMYLRLAGLLHDIGKLTLPGLILGKPSGLTEEEYAMARAHTTRGYRLLSGVAGLKVVRDTVRWHHEAYDGSGYPDGLRASQIPQLARIIAIAEAYDAMTSPRPYSIPLSHQEALEKLKKGAGQQFDPELVNAFASYRIPKQVWKVIESGTDLPVIPSVLTRALEVLCRPEPDFEELAHVLGTDPGFVAKILRYVNSARFGLIAEVTDIRRALVLLGMRKIYRLVLAASSRELFIGDEIKGLWEHSLTTAYAAELIATRSASVLPHEAFVAGLLHDLGKVVLCRAFPDGYRRTLELVNYGVEPYIAEIVVFGTDHSQVGAWLSKQWQFPSSITQALEHHHNLACTPDPLTAVVGLADQAAHAAIAPNPARVPFDSALLDRCEQTPEGLLQIAREAMVAARTTIATMEGVEGDS